MAIQSSQNNTDGNQNAGGAVGEIEAAIGGFDTSSASSATSSATASLAGGDRNVASGKSSAGALGSVKTAALVLAALAFYVVFVFSQKGGK